MQVGDVMAFNPDGRSALCHAGIRNGESVRIARVGETYQCHGMDGGMVDCVEINFVVISSQIRYDRFCSLYVGDDGCEL